MKYIPLTQQDKIIESVQNIVHMQEAIENIKREQHVIGEIRDTYIKTSTRLIICTAICVILWFVGLGMLYAAPAQSFTDKQAILAIIGESESEGYAGMYAVACAIRNRGTLKGVYGLNSGRVVHQLYSKHTYQLASGAWMASGDGIDATNGATGWGNAWDVKQFKKTTWFKKCHITANVKDHYFYACKGEKSKR